MWFIGGQTKSCDDKLQRKQNLYCMYIDNYDQKTQHD